MSIIKSENWDGVSAPAIPSGWTVDSVLVTATTNSPSSAPNSLVYPVASLNSASVFNATWATADTNGGDVQVSGTFLFSGTNTNDQDAWIYARSSTVTTAANWGSTTLYYAGIVHNAAPYVFLVKKISGADTTLGSHISIPSWADGTNYRLFLSCQGTSIRLKLHRLSDGMWLDSTGTWVTDAGGNTWTISVTDSAVSGAGYAGTGFYYAAGASGTVGVDDWLLETTGAATLSASPSHLIAGAGAQTVTLTGIGTAFSTSSSTQFTLSGGTGASIVSQSASSGTLATLSINPGTASGTLTLTDTTDGSITTALTVGGTYYVSPSGSDANTGLDTSHPWQTISHVNSLTLSPGDTILFQGGQTFSGNLLIGQSGTAALPILIGSYGTGQATINPGTGTGIQVKDADWVQLQNLIVAGPGVTLSGTTSSTTSTGIGVEVLSTQTQATVATWRRSIYLTNITISGVFWGIHVHSNAGGDTTPFPVGYNDVKIQNCTVHDCQRAGIRIAASSAAPDWGLNNIGYHKNVYIAGCTVYNIYGVSGQEIQSGNGIIAANTEGGITERCLVHDCGQAQGFTGGGGPVANWCYASHNYIIQYCESYNMRDPQHGDGDGFDLDGGCQDCIIQYCYSHDNDGTGFVWGSYGGPVATTNNTIRYNISQNNGRTTGSSGLRSFNTTSGTRVYNNVFYCDTPFSVPVLIGPLTEGTLANNIFWCGSGVSLFTGVSGGTFAGNLYWFGGGSFSLVYNGVTYSSLAAFRGVQENAGGVPRGLFADPQLRAAGGGGTLLPGAPVAQLAAYALRSSSPAIDAGLDLRTLFALDPGPIDFKGLPNRAGATYDIGACEDGAAALIGASSGARRVNLAGGIGG